MREIDFYQWQQQKKAYLKNKAIIFSQLSPEERISRKPRDEQQFDIIRKADKARAKKLEAEGRFVWTSPRELKIKLK